ncbi:methyltransferase domain-containing protein [Lentzea sp. NPDC051838]|uniref:class I SAM-dependent methyltransferase n=1 Tax=Lentzea sp. NPDC051838 TaxID=3154849 RepID=UPI003423327A
MFSGILEKLPLERALLQVFADNIGANELVADLGCGPGHLTAHLNALGLDAFGVDLSSEMIAIARQAHPDLRFDEGTMTALDIEDGSLGGVLSFYSVIHLPPTELPGVFREFVRVLKPGGQLLLGFYGGDDVWPRTFDHKVTTAYRWLPDALSELLGQAGLTEITRLVRAPYEGERFQQAQLLLRKE